MRHSEKKKKKTKTEEKCAESTCKSLVPGRSVVDYLDAKSVGDAKENHHNHSHLCCFVQNRDLFSKMVKWI